MVTLFPECWELTLELTGVMGWELQGKTWIRLFSNPHPCTPPPRCLPEGWGLLSWEGM